MFSYIDDIIDDELEELNFDVKKYEWAIDPFNATENVSSMEYIRAPDYYKHIIILSKKLPVELVYEIFKYLDFNLSLEMTYTVIKSEYILTNKECFGEYKSNDQDQFVMAPGTLSSESCRKLFDNSEFDRILQERKEYDEKQFENPIFDIALFRSPVIGDG